MEDRCIKTLLIICFVLLLIIATLVVFRHQDPKMGPSNDESNVQDAYAPNDANTDGLELLSKALSESAQPSIEADPLEKYEVADMSDYSGMDGVESVFREMEIADVVHEIDAGSTFIVVFSYAECPYCNAAIPCLSEIARQKDYEVGYVNVRKDPSWKSNRDMPDYGLLCEYLGDYFTPEGETPHMYVPHVFFIKEGKVVFEHSGVTAGFKPSQGLSPTQTVVFFTTYMDGFTALED